MRNIMRNQHYFPIPWYVQYLLPHSISKCLLCIWASQLPESCQEKSQSIYDSSALCALQTSLIEVQFAHFGRTPPGPNLCKRNWGPASPESHRLHFIGSLCRKCCQRVRTLYLRILYLRHCAKEDNTHYLKDFKVLKFKDLYHYEQCG